jgi:tetratricopeptide (TPR) repeat protein
LRLFRAIEHSIEALAEGIGLCLVIEDLHQADESSLHLFHHLARATRSRRLLLVGTLREEAVRVGTGVHTLAGSLAREHLAERILLERLDLDAIAGLVADVVGGSHGATLAPAVHALAEGNPFYAEEVARALRDHEGSQPAPPAGLLETVRHRVRSLGRDAERLLSAAAVSGHRFAFEIARAAAGLDPVTALDALELGIEARVIEEDERDVRFRHALVRRALLEGLTHARRVYLHRALADALEAAAAGEPKAVNAHAEALAHHHEGAGQLDRAIPYLLAAAERAQKHLGFSEAVAFLERARDLMDALGLPASPERFQVLRAMGGMRMALSDLGAAVADLDAAASLVAPTWRPSTTEIATVRRVAALALIQAGRLEEAQARLEEALAMVGDKRSSESSAILYLFAQLRWHQSRFVEARDLAARALAEASARDDRQAMAKGHEMMALAFHSLGEWNQGREHEAKRQELAEGSLDVDQAFDVHLCLWEYHLYGDRTVSETRAAVAQTLAQARRMGAPRAIALCHCFAGAIDFQTGQWREAEEELREAVTLFRQIGSACGESLSLQRLGVLLTARGQIDEARSTLDDALAVGERAAMRSHCLTRVHASLTRNRLAAGDLDGARESLRAGLVEAARHGHCATCNSLLLPEAVRVELASGALREATAFASRLQEVAARFGSRAWTAMATHARARVDAASGKTKVARAAFEEARRAFAEVGYRYDVARCQLAESRIASASAGAPGQRLEEEARRVLSELGATAAEA